MWHTQTACVTGRSHQRNGMPLQDRTCVRTEGGVTAAAVSDGAGSARLSQEGAGAAVQRVCRFLCQHFDALYQSETPAQLRQAVDQAETITASSFWPYPSYGQLLFGVR